MIEIEKSMMITASSIIEDNGQNIMVAHMSANIGSDGNINITKSTTDKDIFKKYKNQILKDFDEFEKYVYDVEN